MIKNKKGYTIIEIMAVLIIIAILATLIIGGIGRYQKYSKEKYVESLVNQVELAAKSYYSDNPSELPRGQILNNQKIYKTSITVKELMDKSSFSGDLVDSEGNSCNESYAVVRNTNNNYNYDVCLICNGKVISGTEQCRLGGNPVVNKNPYCSVSVENQQHNVKKLTVYTNTLNNVVSSNIEAASDGNYYVYKPGNYNFTVKNDEGDEANCSTTVYMEEDKVQPSCQVNCSCDNNSCSCATNWSDNISVKSVRDSLGNTNVNYICSYEKYVSADNNVKSPITINKTISSQIYSVTVTDCNDNTYTCSTTIDAKSTTPTPTKPTTPSSSCDCEANYQEECIVCTCNSSCELRCRTIKNCGGSDPDPEPTTPTKPDPKPTTPTKPDIPLIDVTGGDETHPEEENPVTGCFLSGTKVHTKNGLKNIEEIKVGDYVLSYNEKTKQQEYNKVHKILVHPKNNEDLYELTIDGYVLKVTEAHNFYVKEKNSSEFIWKEAKGLKVGDILLDNNNSEKTITNIIHYSHFGTVYNFAVENNHNYYVSENGYLVHNDKIIGSEQSCYSTTLGGGITNPNMSVCAY